MSTYTPMIEQYLSIKAEHPDAFLFFRLGDFYELFFDDAVLASKELEITLTGRGGGAEERIPMCGVPHHSADSYIQRLVDKGFKVAICEQVEDPAIAKGVVKREVVRIVTPGTMMDRKGIDEKANQYIAALLNIGQAYALAACDLTTGEFIVTEIANGLPGSLDEIVLLQPVELLLPTAIAEDPLFSEWTLSSSTALTVKEERRSVIKLPSMWNSENLSKPMVRIAAYLYDYLLETQKRSLTHLQQIRPYFSNQSLILDPFTRRNLELVETARDKTRKGSLLWLLDRTVTAIGGRMLKRWLDYPLLNRDAILSRQEAVKVLGNDLILRDGLTASLRRVYDLERLVARLSYGNAGPRDLIALKSSLEQVPELIESCKQSASITLKSLAETLDSCQDIVNLIGHRMIDDPPVSAKDGGFIRAGFSEELDRLRHVQAHGKEWIAALEREERQATGIKSLKIGYNKLFGYYIEVTKANISSLPENRYERKQTLANAERFVTPELKQKEALILEAEDKIGELENCLFSELRGELLTHVERIQAIAKWIAEIDVYQSLAEISMEHHFCQPEITYGFDLSIERGRHPVVQSVLHPAPFISNPSEFSEEGQRVLLITGPNMAGKSTYMRQVALIVILAQMGCLVPADKAVVPIVDRIFTRIGAADDLVGGQSTFMVEMKDIQTMTRLATSKSLVIIDELGRGTSTQDGMAIAQSVIEFLHDRIGCKTLVSTHFHELAHLEQILPRLKNYSMAVKESGEQVTFLRQLQRGAASKSYGIYCAKIAGLPDEIIERAENLLVQVDSGMKESAAGKESPIQLELFTESIRQPAAKVTPPQQAAINRLKELDLMQVTPLQAIQILFELKEQMGRKH